jgi:transposase-like protein
VLEAYVNGVSTRKVDRLVEQLGIEGMTQGPSQRAVPSAGRAGRGVPPATVEGAYPYLWLDAKQVKVRDHGGVVSKALVVAYAVHESGVREVIGVDVGEVRQLLDRVLRALKKRGLQGVRLAVSHDHDGLKAAIARVLGRPWRRCTVHLSATCSTTAAETSAG